MMTHLEAQDDLMVDLLHRREEQHREMIARIDGKAGAPPRPAN
jgi:hypothetical protein